ncbi:MAG TPA: VWA domain-containing protein [Candidatus Cloacimonadota bacterium]|nr:VWA domain-containing protein [Candidatus Cloacimonadota bacterium]HOH78901.1 VWA domain-containing protein [Candidatus Cloacimonadota bacterium]
MLQFAKPWLLILLLFIPLYWMIWRQRQKRHQLRVPFPRLMEIAQTGRTGKFWKYFYPGLRTLILLCLVLALSQPRWGRGVRDVKQQGVDIVLAVDISGSMLAEDFAPRNRLSAAVQVAMKLVRNRPNDRFSLVAFSEYALTQSPLTFDHHSVLDQLNRLEVNMQASGTAIGMGLAKAVARLRKSTAKSKVVILITDGVSNTGEIDPISAANMARAYGIRVYPIGVGSNGLVDFPFDDPLLGRVYRKTLIELDMQTLDRIAALTNTGKASLATDTGQLQSIVDQIDAMEKTEYRLRLHYLWSEKFMLLLWISFGLLLIELLSRLHFKPILPE